MYFGLGNDVQFELYIFRTLLKKVNKVALGIDNHLSILIMLFRNIDEIIK